MMNTYITIIVVISTTHIGSCTNNEMPTDTMEHVKTDDLEIRIINFVCAKQHKPGIYGAGSLICRVRTLYSTKTA